jgi:hypothetical protein
MSHLVFLPYPTQPYQGLDTETKLPAFFGPIHSCYYYLQKSYKLLQTRYLEVQSDKKENQTDSCWWIPLLYTTQDVADFNNTKPSLWLNCAENKSVTLTGLPLSDEWVIFNINFAGKNNYTGSKFEKLPFNSIF